MVAAAPVPAVASVNGQHSALLLSYATGLAADEAPECWICKDGDSKEPTIQPCACRGSMSGVHASCVQQWLRHQQGSVGLGPGYDKWPTCTVCHEPYRGEQKKPGVLGVAVLRCKEVWPSFLFHAVLVLEAFITALGFLLAVRGECPLMLNRLLSRRRILVPLVVRGALAALFAVSYGWKLLVLALSLPGQERPAGCVGRLFSTSDWWLLGVVSQLVLGTAVVLGYITFQEGHWQVSLLLLCVTILPLLSRRMWRLLRSCYQKLPRWCRAISQELMQPLGPGPHLYIEVLISGCAAPRMLPLLVIHIFLLLVGLAEVHWGRRWRWQQGALWQLTSVGCLYALFTIVSASLRGKVGRATLYIALCWGGLLHLLLLRVNWGQYLEFYRLLQQRYTSFSLQSRSIATAGAVEPLLPEL